MAHLEELLQQCTVQITIPGQPGWGTGFFVAPGVILTCAHVVKTLAVGATARMRWQQQADFATAELVQLVPNFDLALLQFTPPNAALPCVYLDESLQPGQELYFFGYPDQDFAHGCPVTGSCEGFTGDVPPLIKFKQAQVRPGMSGSALLNRHTSKVCGMVKFTRDRSIDLGGGAIPTRVILEQFPELRDLQREFHQRDQRWSCLLKQPSEIDFQPYLESIAKTYEKWWQYYTLTDAESQQRQTQESAPIFDFGLMVRTVLKQEPEQPQHEKQEQEPVERFSVLEGLRKYALREKPDHVLLVGRPGSGKSTALARLMLEEATTPHARIPVLVELRYWQGSIAQLILNALKRHAPSVTTEQLESVLTQSLLLFDGVNELPSEEARSQLSAFRRDQLKVPMIFTTRDLSLGGDLGIERKLEMQPLTESQMQAFIRAYIPEQAETMLRQLKHRLWEFGQTPLLLWMLCEVFQQAPDNQLPSNLGGVFQAFSKMYEESSVRKHEVALLKGDVSPLSDRRLWKKALMAIASIMMQGGTPVDFRVAIHRDEAERELKAVFPHEKFPVRDILDDLLKYHLLQNRSVDQIEFRHQLIQEYYAAEYLLRILPTLSDEQLKRDYLNYLKWTEPVALMLAMVKEEAHALQVVQMALDVDWKLGAKLAGEVLLDFQAATVGEVIALPVADWSKVELLGQTRSKVAIPELLSFLKHPNINIAEVAASYIGETQDQEAIDILAKRLEEISLKFFSQKLWGGPDRTGNLWTTHVRALAYLSPQAATHFLRDKLEKHDTLLLTITDTATILMQLDFESLIPELLKDFRNAQQEEKRKPTANVQETEVEIQMAELWDSSIQSESAVLPEAWSTIKFTPPPPERLKRNHILNLLENSSDYELFVPTLIEAFEQEPDESIQGQIIQILGKSQYDAAIHLLVQKLGETNGKFRSEAAKQLIKQKSIDNPNSLEAMHKLVDHEDWNISWCTAIVLGHLKDSTVLPRMMYELENHQIPSIRSTAARVLGIIGNPNCVPSLLKAINQDTDRYVRLDAACSLSSFGQKEAIPILLDALKSPTNADPHSGIMKSISSFCIKETLLDIVRSKRLYWQRAAVELGKLFKSQRDDKFVVLPDLFDALVDPGHESSNEIIDLLSELADSETLSRLIDALEHPEKYTSDIYFPNRVALVLVGCCPEMMVNKLFNLKNLSTRNYIPQLFWLIPTIQYRYKLYNYEIAYGIIPQGKTIALYFSSAPSDAELQTQLANHLNLLERQEIITSWHHRQMLPGDERAQVINDRLNSADIILLLISANSIADRTCYDIEINRAMERHQAGEACVIPILLRPVDWQGAPFSQLPVLPRNQQPVTSWGDRDAAFQEIAEGIRAVAIELRRIKGEGTISSNV